MNLCSTCRYFNRQTPRGGQCRRHSQQALYWTDTNLDGLPFYQSSFDWPAVGDDSWCGDWDVIRHSNGEPMFAPDGTMLDESGARSVFDDVDQ